MATKYGFKLVQRNATQLSLINIQDKEDGVLHAGAEHNFPSSDGTLICKVKAATHIKLCLAVIPEIECVEVVHCLRLGATNETGKFKEFTSSPNYYTGDDPEAMLVVFSWRADLVPSTGLKVRLLGHSFLIESDPNEANGFKIFIDDSLTGVDNFCDNSIYYGAVTDASNVIFPIDLLGVATSANLIPQVADLTQALENIEEYLGTGFEARFVSR